ncbi:MAG TPA: purine-nucleoside phosphorylase, partial [Thermoanaerobaculia bacterium]|nr:purine-nucleoside phosphorylase [Thermoanaerobaculia bacterium]
MAYYDDVEAAAAFLRSRIARFPATALVLGSGLGAFADRLESPAVIPYGEIPKWPASNVIGHAGKLVVGRIARRDVAVLSGRVHFYEGHPLTTITFSTRALARLGVKTLVLTNAAGGINTSFSPGTLMVIDDHLNFMGSNPLVGPNEDRFG